MSIKFRNVMLVNMRYANIILLTLIDRYQLFMFFGYTLYSTISCAHVKRETVFTCAKTLSLGFRLSSSTDLRVIRARIGVLSAIRRRVTRELSPGIEVINYCRNIFKILVSFDSEVLYLRRVQKPAA